MWDREVAFDINSETEILTEITAGIKMSELGEMKIISVLLSS